MSVRRGAWLRREVGGAKEQHQREVKLPFVWFGFVFLSFSLLQVEAVVVFPQHTPAEGQTGKCCVTSLLSSFRSCVTLLTRAY